MLQPTRSLRDFVLAVSFFPQLVAGPIVRAGDFLPQLDHPPRLQNQPIFLGTGADDFGLFEKAVLADTMLSGRRIEFRLCRSTGGLDSWAGVLAFAGQIFFDFAGYSICAIGAASSLAFISKTIFVFHMPRSGSRIFGGAGTSRSQLFCAITFTFRSAEIRSVLMRAALNLVIVMFLGGLWHGAAWTFVVWGLFHGSYLVIERVCRGLFENKLWANSPFVRVLAGFATYGAVCIAWVFFRASDFTVASRMLGGMSVSTRTATPSWPRANYYKLESSLPE